MKRIIAPDMREAMRQVRQVFGPDAVILSNRPCEGGVEVIAAMDFDESSVREAAMRQERREAPRPAVETPPNPSASLGQATAKPSPEPAREFPRASAQPAQDPVADRFAERMARMSDIPAAGVRPEASPEQPAEAPVRPAAHGQQAPLRTSIRDFTPRHEMADRAKTPPPGGQMETVEDRAARRALDDLKGEMQGLRQLFEKQLSVIEWSHYTREHPVEVALLERLEQLGLPRAFARVLVQEADALGDERQAWDRALRGMADRLPVADLNLVDSGGVLAMVGPTGVGKTTTLAKLAARSVLRYGKGSVAIISTDHFRIGAQEQLRNYARILDVPMHVARDEAHLSELISGLADKRLVLVDTAGMSQRDFRMIEQLEKLQSAHSALRQCLVLSANTQYATVVDLLKRFREIGLYGLILTKLDEASQLGGTLAAVIRSGLPLLCATNGQRVPEDLINVDAAELVGLAVDLAEQAARIEAQEDVASW
ncbi:MAG: flagellar biosynthesis protein FlhF [Halothiobacillaceae bacterium]